MAIGNVNTTFITKLSVANTSGNDLSALKTKLGKLLKLVKDLAQDDSMSAKQKKETQQLLQIQIQMLIQQIAELERRGQRGEAVTPADEKSKLVISAAPNIRHASSTKTAGTAGSIDTHA